jgi:type IV pilus assembly protein PilV
MHDPNAMIRHNGYSLLEVLVALVVISIGLLGVAAMQATALSGTHTSQTESLVAIQARSLADAMLANSAFWTGTSAPTGTVTVVPSGAAVTITGGGTGGSDLAASPTPACSSGTCSATSMAAYDVQTWAQNYFAAVPNGTQANINCTTTAPKLCTIQLQWRQKASNAINPATVSTSPAVATTASYTLINQF